MANPYELEITICSAKDLKNVNWRNGPLKPYAVVWVDPTSGAKLSTKVDYEGDTNPVWNHTLRVPIHTPPEDATLFIDVVHFTDEDEDSKDTKPLIGSAKLRIRDLIDEVGYGERVSRTLQLKRPSGRPQGKIDVKLQLNRPQSVYYQPPPPPPLPYDYYGVARDSYSSYPAPPEPTPYGANPYSYGAAPPPEAVAPSPYYSAPPAGYPAYGQPGASAMDEKKSGKFGMGTGLAVGAVAGVLGGLALAEGVDYVEDKIADDVADEVEDDVYDDDGF